MNQNADDMGCARRVSQQTPPMGPALLLRHDADGMGWAYRFSQNMWSMTLNGPSVGAGSYYRWHGVGPLFLRNMLSKVLNGP